MNKKFWWFFVLIILSACNNNSENVTMKSLNGKWKKNELQKIDFEIKDAQNLKNIIFVVRNNNDYPYSNLRLFTNIINIQTKKYILETDTLNYILAKPNGEWIGSGFGETKEILFQFKNDFRFPKNGKYSVIIQQAMRKDLLPGIEDIGIKIEPSK